MPLPERNPVHVTISITKSAYAYLKDWIEKTADSSKTVPGYLRRLVRHYVWSLREPGTAGKIKLFVICCNFLTTCSKTAILSRN